MALQLGPVTLPTGIDLQPPIGRDHRLAVIPRPRSRMRHRQMAIAAPFHSFLRDRRLRRIAL